MSDDLYDYLGQLFEWDRMKAARNAIKHRVRFTEFQELILKFGPATPRPPEAVILAKPESQ